MLDTELELQFLKLCAVELRAIIRDNSLGYTESVYDIYPHEVSDVTFSWLPKARFGPFGEVVHYHDNKLCMTFAFREWSNPIDHQLGEWTWVEDWYE